MSEKTPEYRTKNSNAEAFIELRHKLAGQVEGLVSMIASRAHIKREYAEAIVAAELERMALQVRGVSPTRKNRWRK